MRIKSVGFVIGLTMALAVFGLAAWLSFRTAGDNSAAAMAMESEAMEEIVGATARSLDEYLQLNVTRMKALAESEALVRSLAGLSEHLAQERLERAMAELRGYWALFSYDKTGKVNAGVTASGQDLRGQQVNDRDYYKAIVLSRESVFISEVFRPNTGEMTGFSLAAPVYDSRGGLLGGVAAVLDRQAMTEELLSPVRLGETGFAFVWDERLRVIAHPDPAMIFKDLGAEDYARRARQEQRGILTYEVGSRTRRLAFDTLPLTGWIVGLSVFEDELPGSMARRSRQGRTTGLAGAAGLAVLALFLCWVLVASPARRLGKYAAEVASGDLLAEPRGRFPLEFGSLAREMKTLVKEMRGRASYSHGVLNALPAPCIVTSRDARVAFVNKEFLDLLRKPGEPERYLGMACRELVKDDPRAVELLAKAIAEHRPMIQRLELGPLGGDAERRGMILSARVNPFYDQDNVLQGTVVQWTDETELHEERQKTAELQQELQSCVAVSQELVRRYREHDAEHRAGESARKKLENFVREACRQIEERNRLLAALKAEKEDLERRIGTLTQVGGESLGDVSAAGEELFRMAGRVGELANLRREKGEALRAAAETLEESRQGAASAAGEAAEEGRQAREILARGRLAAQGTVNAMARLPQQAAALLRNMGELYARSEQIQQSRSRLDSLTEMLNMVSVNASIKALRQTPLSGEKLAALAEELRQISSQAKLLIRGEGGAGGGDAGDLRQFAEAAIQAGGDMVETLERTARLSQAAVSPARESHRLFESIGGRLQAVTEFLEPQKGLAESLVRDMEAMREADPDVEDGLRRIVGRVDAVSRKLGGTFNCLPEGEEETSAA